MERPSIDYRLYRLALRLIFASDASRVGRPVAAAGRWYIGNLARKEHLRRKVAFPTRTTGGWRSTTKWRYEFLKGWLEYGTVRHCRQHIQDGMFVVDVGAHIGYFTCLFSELVGKTGRIIAFEPEESNYQLLKQNVDRLGCGNVTTEHRAVHGSVGELRLYLGTGHSNHTSVAGFAPDGTETETVPTVSLDAYLSDLGNPQVDFVKIDVEGAEIDVLAGMRETVATNPGLKLIVELNPRAQRAGGHEPNELIHTLQALGFRVQQVADDGKLTPPNPNVRDGVNLLCTRD